MQSHCTSTDEMPWDLFLDTTKPNYPSQDQRFKRSFFFEEMNETIRVVTPSGGLHLPIR